MAAPLHTETFRQQDRQLAAAIAVLVITFQVRAAQVTGNAVCI
ncbi:hypothetical protein [Mycobacteroides abscessus]|nr:hypothetical protein [Mycobacteroides abscessus]